MSYVDTGTSVSGASAAANDLSNTLDLVQSKTDKLTLNVGSLRQRHDRARSRKRCSGGKQFDDVLKSLALKLSDLAVKSAFKSAAGGLSGGLSGVFSGFWAAAAAARSA